MRHEPFRFCKSGFPLCRSVSGNTDSDGTRFVDQFLDTIPIARGRRRLHEYVWPVGTLRDRLTHHAHSVHTRFIDLRQSLRRVPAVDVLAGEIDYSVGSVDLARPLAQRPPVPRNRTSGPAIGIR